MSCQLCSVAASAAHTMSWKLCKSSSSDVAKHLPRRQSASKEGACYACIEGSADLLAWQGFVVLHGEMCKQNVQQNLMQLLAIPDRGRAMPMVAATLPGCHHTFADDRKNLALSCSMHKTVQIHHDSPRFTTCIDLQAAPGPAADPKASCIYLQMHHCLISGPCSQHELDGLAANRNEMYKSSCATCTRQTASWSRSVTGERTSKFRPRVPLPQRFPCCCAPVGVCIVDVADPLIGSVLNVLYPCAKQCTELSTAVANAGREAAASPDDRCAANRKF